MFTLIRMPGRLPDRLNGPSVRILAACVHQLVESDLGRDGVQDSPVPIRFTSGLMPVSAGNALLEGQRAVRESTGLRGGVCFCSPKSGGIETEGPGLFAHAAAPRCGGGGRVLLAPDLLLRWSDEVPSDRHFRFDFCLPLLCKRLGFRRYWCASGSNSGLVHASGPASLLSVLVPSAPRTS